MPLPIKKAAAIAYQDDKYTIDTVESLENSWALTLSVIERYCHKVNVAKTKLFIPGADQVPISVFLEKARIFISNVDRVINGMKILGGAAQSEFETYLGVYQQRLLPATKQVEKAVKLVDGIIEMLHKSTLPATTHAVWYLLSKVVKEALAYDIRIVPALTLPPLMHMLESSLWTGFQAPIGVELVPACQHRVTLPGPLRV